MSEKWNSLIYRCSPLYWCEKKEFPFSFSPIHDNEVEWHKTSVCTPLIRYLLCDIFLFFCYFRRIPCIISSVFIFFSLLLSPAWNIILIHANNGKEITFEHRKVNRMKREKKLSQHSSYARNIKIETIANGASNKLVRTAAK